LENRAKWQRCDQQQEFSSWRQSKRGKAKGQHLKKEKKCAKVETLAHSLLCTVPYFFLPLFGAGAGVEVGAGVFVPAFGLVFAINLLSVSETSLT